MVDCLIPEDQDPGAVRLSVPEPIAAARERSVESLAALRASLSGLDASARTLYGVVFADASPDDRAALLRHFQQGDPPAGEWTITNARQFFRQLRSEVVDAYYQDPPAWPLVGYPGYSMPFGYPDGGPCGAIGEDDR